MAACGLGEPAVPVLVQPVDCHDYYSLDIVNDAIDRARVSVRLVGQYLHPSEHDSDRVVVDSSALSLGGRA